MAKRLLFDYEFTPALNKIVIPGNINQRRLLVITNTTDNIIIYNFADPNQTATFSFDAEAEETTLILAHDCSAMDSTDSLQIFEESEAVHFEPSETYVDPVSKFRVSNPENLIDTDFEYGPQASKWETLQLVNNIPSSYSSSSDTTIPNIVSVQSTANSDIILVTTLYEHDLIAGTPIDVKGLANPGAEGNYLIQSVPTVTTFTYRCREVQATSDNLAGAYTSVIPGQFYSNSQIILDSQSGLLSDTRTYSVSTPYGTSGGYYIDNVEKPDVTTNKNGIYYFNMNSTQYTSHPFRFSDHGELETLASNEAPMGLFDKKIVGIASDGTKVVALSEDGEVYDNDNLLVRSLGETANNWESKAIDGTAKIKSVAYSPELKLYVGVGNAEEIWYSYDLREWTQNSRTPNAANDLRSVIWSAEKFLFVAVGTNGVILTSPTGIGDDWTVRDSGITLTDIFQEVIWAKEDELFVVVGSNSAGTSGAIYTSPDGVSWTSRTSNSAVILNGVKWSADVGLYVAVGASGVIITSPDGTTWTARTSGTSNALNAVACSYYNGVSTFLAIGATQTALTSTDGLTWATRVTGTTGELTDLIWDEDNSVFKITDVNGKVITTDQDAQTYTDISVAGHRLDRIVYSGFTYFVFSGDGGLAGTQAYFAKRQEWASLTTISASGGGTTTFRKLIHATDSLSQGYYVAVGENSLGGNGVIITSTNGTSWNEQQTAAIPDDGFYNVEYVVDTWYFLGNNGLYSTQDFVTWTDVILRESVIDTFTGGTSTDATRTPGTYNSIEGTTNGNGNGALFNIEIDALGATTVTMVNPGIGYTAGDTIEITNANFGGTGGDITLTVQTLTSTTDGFRDFVIIQGAATIVGLGGRIWYSADLADWSVGKITTEDAKTTSTTGTTYSLTVTFDQTGDYTVNGTDSNGSVSGYDPAVTIRLGDTLSFDASATYSEHPLYIRVSDGGASATGAAGEGTSTVTFTPTSTGVYYYQCSVHGTMLGIINVLPSLTGATSTGTDFPATLNFHAIAYDSTLNNRYVAGGNGGFYYSQNGHEWLAADYVPNLDDVTVHDLYHDGVRFLAATKRSLARPGVTYTTTPYLHEILGSFDGKNFMREETPLSGDASGTIDGSDGGNTDYYNTIFSYVGSGPNDIYVYFGSESGRIDLMTDNVVPYTENVYYHTAVGEDHYTRLYVTTSTPDNLFYYCNTHGLSMGGNLFLDQVSSSNVYMKTLDENGFSQGTDFYIVNTISPKVVEVLDGTATAPDGRPYIDTEETLNVDFNDDQELTEVRDYEPSYVLKFDETNIDVASRTITFAEDHKLKDGYALFYYTAPGDKPIGGMASGQVYYADVVGAKSIRLTQCGFSTYEKKNEGDFPVPFHRWSQVNRLKAQTTDGNNTGQSGSAYFGRNVAMSGDGNYLIVGSDHDDSYGSNRGAAYIFKKENGSWNIKQRIGGGSGNSNSDHFGWSCDINYDGSVVVVGIPYDDPAGTDSGRIHIWERSGESWTQPATATPPDSNNYQYFGRQVSINGAGTIIAVGAYNRDQGGADRGEVYVYTYDINANTLALEAQIQPTDGTISNTDYFGSSICLDKDGYKLVVGAERDDQTNTDSGSAYYFYRSPAAPFTWTQGQRLNSPNPSTSAYYGNSICISPDGTVLAIGAYGDDTYGSDWGAVYIYDWNAGTSSWDYAETIGPELPATTNNTQGKASLYFSYSESQHGRTIGLSNDGSIITVGCGWYDVNGINREGTWSNVGATYVFERSSGSYVLEARILGTHSRESSYMGCSVDISEDGNYIVSGAYNEYEYGPTNMGAAYVFDGTTANHGATFDHGKHNFGLCYRIARETHERSGDDHYLYTAYYAMRAQNIYSSTPDYRNISGYDLQEFGSNSFGLAGTGGPYGSTDNIDNTYFITPYRTGPGYPRDWTHIGGAGHFGEDYREQTNYGRSAWWGYGDILPFMSPLRRTGLFGRNDFMVDDKTNSARYNALGPWGSGDSDIAPHYDRRFNGNNNPYVYSTNNDYINHRASYSYAWWYYSGGYFTNQHNYFSGWGDNWNGNYYLIPLRKLVEKNSFYSADHGLNTNDEVQYEVVSGQTIKFMDGTGFINSPINELSEPRQVFIEKVDNNRFRIKTSTTGNALRIMEANGQYRFTGTVTNFRKNSMYVDQHNLSTNNALLYNNEGITPITGLTDNTLYYANVLNSDRFQVRTAIGKNFNGNITAGSNQITGMTINPQNELTTGQIVTIIANGDTLSLPTDTTIQTIDNSTTITLTNAFSGTGTINGVSFNSGLPEVDLTGQGSGLQAFEDQTTDFGVSDGGFKNTYIVDERTLEVRVPFKIRPSRKLFDANTDVNAGSDAITIPNHFFKTGSKVIYSSFGNPALPGLDDNKDYYVIVLDDEQLKLAHSYADAHAGNAVDITAVAGYSQEHGLIHTNVAGDIVGSGSVSFEDGSRTVVGTDTNFKRYFKVGDTVTFIDTTTSPGTFITKEITAIKDDFEMLMDSNFTTTDPNGKYLIGTLVYTRPDGYYLHRPFDGGMEIGTSKSPDGLICRQTRKYFRYQSGKGIQTSFAINFNPLTPATSAVYFTAASSGDSTSGHYIRIQTKYAHNLNTDLEITIAQANEDEFNGSYAITEIVNDFEFVVDAVTAKLATQATGFFGYHIVEWANSNVRAGMFDFQNGFFFEFDGKDLYCVRRSATQQMTGVVNTVHNSNAITGVDTKFTTQLGFGDKIVVRGQTYKVVKVTSDTLIKVQPSYRGSTTENVIITKVVDTRVPQSEWNIDKCDGTGATGFALDLTKIQMCYADYSWYGAGKIRFGFKDQNGHVKYIHAFKHNNRLTESYFRSGNLPARYEIENIGTPTFIPSLFHWGTSVIMDGLFQDDESYVFTASGNVQKFTNTSSTAVTQNANSNITWEYAGSGRYRLFIRIPFPSADATTLTTGTLIFNETTTGFLQDYFKDGRPVDRRSFISGSTFYAYIQYVDATGADSYSFRPYYYDLDADKPASSTVYYAGAPQGENNQIETDLPLVSIRLAPSVDSSLTGLLGEREIINRMQLKLDSVDIQTTHETEISLVLNPALSSDNFVTADNPSLSQLLKHEAGDTISGGQKIFTFRASGGSVDSTTGKKQAVTTAFDLSKISDLGNSILGGDDVFPNGPDVLTVVANIIDSTGVSGSNPYTITGKISWSESQA